MSDPVSPGGASRASARWSVGASAAACASGLVALSGVLAPTQPTGIGAWIDAVMNEWIVWFTVLYLAALAIVAIRDRILRRA